MTKDQGPRPKRPKDQGPRTKDQGPYGSGNVWAIANAAQLVPAVEIH